MTIPIRRHSLSGKGILATEQIIYAGVWDCRHSSVVEQRFCKAKVVGSNPIAGSLTFAIIGFDSARVLCTLHGESHPHRTTPRLRAVNRFFTSLLKSESLPLRNFSEEGPPSPLDTRRYLAGGYRIVPSALRHVR